MTDDFEEPRKDKDGRISVLLEMHVERGESLSLGQSTVLGLGGDLLQIDPEFDPVPMTSENSRLEGFGALPDTYVLRGTVASEKELRELERDPRVKQVWKDTPIEPFAQKSKSGGKKTADPRGEASYLDFDDSPAMSTCPFGTCDCSSTVPKGSISQIAVALGCDKLWERGFRGQNMVVGIVDSGMTAQGRPVISGQTNRRIPRVIGGWPTDSWGTRSEWSQHGNMCGTDVLGMAPDAQLLDLRISGAANTTATISRALQAYQWAIERYRRTGTPHVLSNSWGLYRESLDPAYARDPNHPFTRKMAEAVDLGIIVVFAAGNCGDTCPDNRCSTDTGSGRSIWGANGHPKVMTVGAVNLHEQLIGYSSRGPASLAARKPDFCSYSHFTGYFHSDSGTSAACPTVAGLCALLKQARPTKTPDQLKNDLIATCKDIGPVGFDIHSGHGIIRGWEAYNRRPSIVKHPIIDNIGTSVVPDLIGTPVRLDQVTTPVIRDQIATPVRQDQIITPVTQDQIGTNPAQDTIATPVRQDQIATPVTQDTVGTNPIADQPGTPLPADVLGTPAAADPIQPPIPGRGLSQMPFVLSTAHHAPDWRSFEEMVGGQQEVELADVADLVARIDQTQAALDSMIEEYHAVVAALENGSS